MTGFRQRARSMLGNDYRESLAGPSGQFLASEVADGLEERHHRAGRRLVAQLQAQQTTEQDGTSAPHPSA